MSTIIIVSEGDEQSTFTSKRAMCDAHGWDYRKFRDLKGVPNRVGKYRLKKCEVGLTIPCLRLRSFLAKKLTVAVTYFDEDKKGMIELAMTFKKLRYTAYVVDSTKVVVRVVDASNESIVMDEKTKSILTNILPSWIK